MMADKPSLIFAAKTIPGVGGGLGQNLRHMTEALSLDYAIELICTGKVPSASLADALMKVPVLRKKIDWETLIRSKHFDREVSQRLPSLEGDLFFGAEGQCFESFEVARGLGKKTVLDVVTAHVDHWSDCIAEECERFSVPLFAPRSIRELTKASYDVVDGIRVMSEYGKKTLAVRGVESSKIVVAPPYVDLDEFQFSPQRSEKFRVSFVGLLAPWKGVRFLVEAFEQFDRSESELIFWGGTGSRSMANYFQRAQERAPEIQVKPVAIRELGYQKTYGSSHVLVHPTLSDGFGYVVLEALASGTPVIVTDRAGSTDLIQDGVNGFVIPSGNPSAIVEKLELLKKDRDLVEEMGENARKTAQKLTQQGLREKLNEVIDVAQGTKPSQRAAS